MECTFFQTKTFDIGEREERMTNLKQKAERNILINLFLMQILQQGYSKFVCSLTVKSARNDVLKESELSIIQSPTIKLDFLVQTTTFVWVTVVDEISWTRLI